MTESSLDTALQLVADRHRRRAILHLRHEAEGNTSVEDLVDAVCNGGSAIDREHLAIQLYHTHLPRLAEHGVVEFDPASRAIRYQSDEHIEAVLDSLPDELSLAHP